MVEVWTPEALFSSWLNTSVILLTASLIFYHMTRLKNPTLKVPPLIAALLVSFIIVTDVCIGVAALIPYILRSKELIKTPERGLDISQEKSFRILYSAIGVFIVIIELSVCIYVVKDALSRSKRS